MEEFQVKKGKPYPLGATVKSNGVNFSMVNSSNQECGIVLYHKKNEQIEKIPFYQKHRIGNISCMFIEGLDIDAYDYNVYVGDNIFVDPYAKRVLGNEIWGGADEQTMLRGGFYESQFEWQKTKPLHIPYHESIFYCLHVRGFTQHASSKVKHRGTFEGMMEKIPYLKELGITAVELLPAYEFEECETGEDKFSIEYQVRHYAEVLPEAESDCKPEKVNYWGFKEGYYFAPKASYAASKNPCEEFKRMVREFHKNGIEVIMQFYFPERVKQAYILEILKHWVLEYRIDGVHLKGNRIPVTLLATEPLFANLKIMCEDFSLDEIYAASEVPAYKNLGYYREEFMYDTRRFLKGDSDMLKGFQYHMRNQNPKCGVVNFMTNYYGFTMMDLVSYDRKHNEANDENNADGTDYNYSWNCGMEGPTRKKSVLQLRKQQIRNAFSFLLTAQGTPLILAGDEFGNSQDGNNNCYSQDNEISWLDWRLTKKNEDILLFVKDMIQFRKNHPILHREEEMTMTDKYGYGYPDLSYHGEEAWKVQLENYNRHIAMMYCGRYAHRSDQSEDDYLYVAYNMHWETRNFALPVLPCGYTWQEAVNTQVQTEKTLQTKQQKGIKVNKDIKINNEVDMQQEKMLHEIEVAGRSVQVWLGKPVHTLTEKKRGTGR